MDVSDNEQYCIGFVKHTNEQNTLALSHSKSYYKILERSETKNANLLWQPQSKHKESIKQSLDIGICYMNTINSYLPSSIWI